jgi:hypothetical protein
MSKNTFYGIRLKPQHRIDKNENTPPFMISSSEEKLKFNAQIYFNGAKDLQLNYNNVKDWFDNFDIVTIEMEFPDE